MKNCYADPTANTAIANVDRERRKKERQETRRPSHRSAPEKPRRPLPAPLSEAEKWLIALWPVAAE